MEKTARGVKKLASAREVPGNCDDKPLFLKDGTLLERL
jgi:hypothetical protein